MVIPREETTMQVSEVRIKLAQNPQDRLLGFCSITFDEAFVIRDLKIIEGARGPFVAMPSRKLTDRCRDCGGKNPFRAAYCNQCGVRLSDNRAPKDDKGRAKLYADIAHPINSDCRELIQSAVIVAFNAEIVLAQQPGYVCRYDDYGDALSDYDQSDAPDTERLTTPAPIDSNTTSPIVDQETTSTNQHNQNTESTAYVGEKKQRPNGPHFITPDQARANKQHCSDEFGDGL